MLYIYSPAQTSVPHNCSTLAQSWSSLYDAQRHQEHTRKKRRAKDDSKPWENVVGSIQQVSWSVAVPCHRWGHGKGRQKAASGDLELGPPTMETSRERPIHTPVPFRIHSKRSSLKGIHILHISAKASLFNYKVSWKNRTLELPVHTEAASTSVAFFKNAPYFIHLSKYLQVWSLK